MKYFLITFETETAINEATDTIELLRRFLNEKENAFSSRIGNVNNEPEKMYIFVRGFYPSCKQFSHVIDVNIRITN